MLTNTRLQGNISDMANTLKQLDICITTGKPPLICRCPKCLGKIHVANSVMKDAQDKIVEKYLRNIKITGIRNYA